MHKTVVTLLGDPYHEAEPLQEFVKNLIPESKIIHSTVQEMKKHLASNPDLFLLSKENRVTKETTPTWLTDELDEAIDRYVRKGGKLFVLHSGLSSYPSGSKLRALTKGHFLSHPPELVEVTMESLVLIDEHYFVEVDESSTEVLFDSASEAGKSIAGWRHQVGEGSVLCFTPTHTKEAMQRADFQDFTRNLMTWFDSK